MFASYFDESSNEEKPDTKYYVIAGYVAPFVEWARFERPWRKALRPGTSFHATDLDGGHKDFHYLKGRIDERRELQRRFAEVTKSFGMQGVSVSVSLKHHADAEKPVVKGQEHMNAPHMMAFRAFVQFIALINFAHYPKETVAFVCSEGRYVGRMRELYNDIKRYVQKPWVNVLGSFSVHAMRGSPALQSADQLAYETFRFREAGPTAKPREPLEILRLDNQVCEYDLAERYYDKLTFAVRDHVAKAEVILDRPQSLT